MLGLALLALAACSKKADHGFQGWVEADLIFVSPDEAGRVDTLSVREGDRCETGAPLFAVDPELQQADVDMAKASLTNATLAYDRAKALLKIAGRHAEDGRTMRRRRCAPRRRGSIRRRPGWRAARCASPVNGSVQQIYYRPGEVVPAGRPVVSLLPPGNIKIQVLRAGDDAARRSRSART